MTFWGDVSKSPPFDSTARHCRPVLTDAEILGLNEESRRGCLFAGM